MEDTVLFRPLKGKVAVVTGAGEEIGGLFAMMLAKAGARVALLDEDKDKALPYATGILEDGGMGKAYGCSLLSKEECTVTAEMINKDFGRCSILVNCANCNMRESEFSDTVISLSALEQSSFEDMFCRRFLAMLVPSQIFARYMTEDNKGCIINVFSVGAERPVSSLPALSAADAAVESFTKWMAVHLSDKGIRVNAISRGFLYSIGDSQLCWNEGFPSMQTSKNLAAIPMGRGGEREELEGALLFLADEKASGYINGTILTVDGGFSANNGT